MSEPGLHLEVRACGLIANSHGGVVIRVNGTDITNATQSLRLEMAAWDLIVAHLKVFVHKLDMDVRALLEVTDPMAAVATSP